MFFLSRYSKTAKHKDCLHLSVRTSSSVPSCSGCDGLWLNSKPGVHDVRECSVSPVSPQDKLDWTAHFQNALLSRPDCCLASVKPAPYISSTLQLTLDFTVFVFFIICYAYFFTLNSEVIREKNNYVWRLLKKNSSLKRDILVNSWMWAIIFATSYSFNDAWLGRF